MREQQPRVSSESCIHSQSQVLQVNTSTIRTNSHAFRMLEPRTSLAYSNASVHSDCARDCDMSCVGVGLRLKTYLACTNCTQFKSRQPQFNPMFAVLQATLRLPNVSSCTRSFQQQITSRLQVLPEWQDSSRKFAAGSENNARDTATAAHYNDCASEHTCIYRSPPKLESEIRARLA